MKIVIVRIRKGDPRRATRETLEYLNLKKINNCTIIPDTPAYIGMLQIVKDYITWGPATEEGLISILPRADVAGITINEYLESNKKDFKSLAAELLGEKSLKDLGLSRTIRLHPPRGGHGSVKRLYPDGAIGNRKEDINKLLKKMR
ncbi:uL30 family ribosomal protein [Candidatus Undinarchaeota archaeon]